MELAEERAGGWAMCREGSASFVEHKSHLSRMRTSVPLFPFDVALGRGGAARAA